MLGQRHHVHVAFHDQHALEFAVALAGLVQAVELAALVEHRGLGRVQVFGRFGIGFKDAPTEAEHATARIAHELECRMTDERRNFAARE